MNFLQNRNGKTNSVGRCMNDRQLIMFKKVCSHVEHPNNLEFFFELLVSWPCTRISVWWNWRVHCFWMNSPRHLNITMLPILYSPQRPWLAIECTISLRFSLFVIFIPMTIRSSSNCGWFDQLWMNNNDSTYTYKKIIVHKSNIQNTTEKQRQQNEFVWQRTGERYHCALKPYSKIQEQQISIESRVVPIKINAYTKISLSVRVCVSV